MNNKIQWTDDYRVYEDLPNDARIIFTIDGKEIAVRVGEGMLLVSAINRIAVHPTSSNAIRIVIQED